MEIWLQKWIFSIWVDVNSKRGMLILATLRTKEPASSPNFKSNNVESCLQAPYFSIFRLLFNQNTKRKLSGSTKCYLCRKQFLFNFFETNKYFSFRNLFISRRCGASLICSLLLTADIFGVLMILLCISSTG